jgi:DNA-directed RNA polymerase specialized sigma24 family protein
MFPFQPKPDSRPTFEGIFFEHYSRLLEWALQFARGDRSEADDLVQELYVRFARLDTAPEHIESVENYLFHVLRNLHYARVRSARTSAIDDLSIVDFDSVEWGLWAVDRNELLFVRADLHRICDYLCERKNASRSASIFILRYFLGYFPNEVMKVTQSTRVAVDKAIQAVRREARLDLARPRNPRPGGASREGRERTSPLVDDPHSLFLALRSSIFHSCLGECFGRALLSAKYGEPGQMFTTAELAHLVSCVICLDQANEILGLPLLEERSPDETIGRDTPQGPGSSGGQTPTLLPRRSSQKKEDLDKRRRRLLRHAQEVDQHRPQRLFIAVEGEVRASHRVAAPLNELHVELGRAETPKYIEVLSEQGICLAFLLVRAPSLESDLYQSQNAPLSDDRSIQVVVSFAATTPTIRVTYRDPLITADDEMAEVEDQETTVVSRSQPEDLPLLSRLGKLTRLFPLTMNPLLTSAALLFASSLICILLWTWSGPGISAGTLLSRAQQSDASAQTTVHPGVIYQKVRISEPGRVIERAIYRDPTRKRRPKRQILNSDAQHLKEQLDLAGVNWDEPLAAANYGDWRNRLLVKRDVVTRAGKGLLTLSTSAGAGSPVLRESLTVRESDFHAVERTIELRDKGTVEIAELNYDVMPWGVVNQDWFEPLEPTTLVHPSLAPPLPRLLSAMELDEAELAARVTLNELHADTGEQIQLSRRSNRIDIKGVVDTDARKEQLVSRLAQLPNVHTSILSAEEIGTRPLAGSTFRNAQPVQVYAVEAQPSHLEQYLREKKMPLDQLATIYQSLLEESLRIQHAENHLSALRQSFGGANHLPADQQGRLAGLSKNYINALRAGLDANQRTLLSIGLGKTGHSTPDSNLPGDDIDSQVRRYHELCQRLITSEAGETTSAAEIAGELGDLDLRIRTTAAQIEASVSTARN